MAGDRHHDSAVCHLATNLLTRIATCWRNGEPYVLRDVDGTAITDAEGRAIVKERYKIDHEAARRSRRTPHEATPQASDGPGVTGVAKRSNIPARQHQHTSPQVA